MKGGGELRDRLLTVSFAGGLDRGGDVVVGEVVVSRKTKELLRWAKERVHEEEGFYGVRCGVCGVKKRNSNPFLLFSFFCFIFFFFSPRV